MLKAPSIATVDGALIWADDASLELPSTSHMSIVDSYGNVLSMTTTIENRRLRKTATKPMMK